MQEKISFQAAHPCCGQGGMWQCKGLGTLAAPQCGGQGAETPGTLPALGSGMGCAGWRRRWGAVQCPGVTSILVPSSILPTEEQGIDTKPVFGSVLSK